MSVFLKVLYWVVVLVVMVGGAFAIGATLSPSLEGGDPGIRAIVLFGIGFLWGMTISRVARAVYEVIDWPTR